MRPALTARRWVTQAAIPCVAGLLFMSVAAHAFDVATPTSTSLCDDAQYRGTDIYNKYCSAPSSGGGSAAPAAAPNAANQMMLNVMQAATPYVQQAIHDALYGNPAQDAAREAERRRQQEERARKEEETRARLLGESNEPGQMSMMGLQTSGASLQMMTGDQALQPMETPTPKQETHTDAYNRGHDDAARCGSANAGPYCAAAADTSACVSDYDNGFQVGSQERKERIVEAYQSGRQAGARNEPASAGADMRAEGECRVDWIQAYNQGYQETHAPASMVPAR